MRIPLSLPATSILTLTLIRGPKLARNPNPVPDADSPAGEFAACV